jgi:hypothetical protein
MDLIVYVGASNFNRLYRQDETLANLIKQSTQRREKRRNKERGPKSEPKEQTPKWVTMGAQEQIMFQNTQMRVLPEQGVCLVWSLRGGRVTKDLESTLGSAPGRLVILVTSPVLGSYLLHTVAASYPDMSSCLMAESWVCSLHYSIPQASHSWPAQIYCCKI